MTGKERYEERRQQEHDNEMERLRKQKAYYAQQTEGHELGEIVMRAARLFLAGQAYFHMEPSNQPGCFVLRFIMPPE